MWTLTRRIALVAALALVGLGSFSTPAQAQRRIGPTTFPYRPPINYNYYVAPGLTLRQWAYNTRLINRVNSTIPPYMLGYNPYPQTINYGPSYYNPYSAYSNLNPYSAYSSMYNPYATYGSGYNPYDPYGVYGYSYLYR